MLLGNGGKEMKRFLVLMTAAVLVLGLSGISSAIDDPGADYGPIDLTSAEVEVYDRGDINLLKLSITATPSVPAAITFEVDVDNSTGTGGSISQIGAPAPPCPCKIEPGFDIITAIYTRQQGDTSGSAIAASCSDNNGACGRRRESGEWYAVTSLGGQPIRAIGILRGLLDPVPKSPESGATEDCYTLPWSYIIAYANQYQDENSPGDVKNFNYVKARANDYADGKWQVSIYYDPTAQEAGGDEDDIASNGQTTFDINDFAPNVGKADIIKSLGATDLTYCEGNFDGDRDVDGGDAAKFKANFGRSPFKNPCPACGPNY
jgi:hypothetical protein